MKRFYFLLLGLFSIWSCSTSTNKKSDEKEVTTVYLIRHAEKNRDNPQEKDPKLTKKGTERAIHWSQILKNVPFDAVYSTNYKRTIATGKPTAEQNDLKITDYPSNKLPLETFFEKGFKNVLVVGHSNTVPKLVNNMIGENTYPDIEDANNGNLYVVTFVDKKPVSVNLLTID